MEKESDSIVINSINRDEAMATALSGSTDDMNKLQNQINIVLGYLMVFVWIGLLGHMRVFSRYRLLMKAFQSSAWHLLPFLGLTIIILMAFGMSYTYFEHGEFTLAGFVSEMAFQHRLFLGDFNDFFGNIGDTEACNALNDEDKAIAIADGECYEQGSKFTKELNFFLFVSLTIIEPLIMLNLLIALVSKVYTDLTDSDTKNDYAAKNRMVLEFETMQIWNREVYSPS